MFDCQYCKTKFLTEENYGKHKCEEEVRINALKTPNGKMALKYYQIWFKKRARPLTPSAEIFINSRHYKVFFKFREYALKMGIPDVELYIELMAKNSILPQHWYVDDIYNYFMNHFDKECGWKVHLRVTLSTLERLSTSFDCKISEVFSHLHPRDMITLIQSRNLSPWILLLSQKFKLYLANDANYEEQNLIESVINLDRWRLILDVNQKSIPQVREYLKQLDL